MLNNFLAVFLLVIVPALNLWRSLRPKSEKPERPLLRRYWTMSWHSLVLLGVLWVGSSQAGYTLDDLGFDGFPLAHERPSYADWADDLRGLLTLASDVAGRDARPCDRSFHETPISAGVR